MSLIATRQDFEPANPAEGATAMYYQPADGSGYNPNAVYIQSRINSLRGFAAPNNQKLAIWGCGWGALVNLAVQAGYDAHGFDASNYAITKGQSLWPSISTRLHVRDALNSADVTASLRDSGITGGRKFALLVTDDMLTCMSDTEISTTLPLLRNSCLANLLHVIWPVDPWAQANGLLDSRINWKTGAQWKALLSPPDQVYDTTIAQVL